MEAKNITICFQGLRADGLDLLNKAKIKLKCYISEITNPAHIEMFMEMVDIFQVGARNMQNFEILKELGKTNKPVLIKRDLQTLMKNSNVCRICYE